MKYPGNYVNVKAHRRNNKVKLFQAFASKCACCGIVDDPIIYDFHHINETEKEATIAKMGRSWQDMVIEAQKCAMLCSHCHRKFHAGMIQIPEDYPRFDENLIDVDLLKLKSKKLIDCPVCGNSMSVRRQTCSLKCRGLSQRKIGRPDKSDLQKVFNDIGIVRTAEKYEVTTSTIYKWLNK